MFNSPQELSTYLNAPLIQVERFRPVILIQFEGNYVMVVDTIWKFISFFRRIYFSVDIDVLYYSHMSVTWRS